jgi:competence protein ComEA
MSKEDGMKAKQTVIFCIILSLILMVALPVGAQQAKPAKQQSKININKATVVELTQLAKIGEKYAERIVEFRKKNGPFKKPEDIMKVKGIGEKTYKLNKDKIVIK